MAVMFKTNMKQLMLKKSVEVGDSLNKRKVSEQTGLSYPAISRWYSGTIDRIESESTGILLDYFNCGLCDLVEVVKVPEEKSKTYYAIVRRGDEILEMTAWLKNGKITSMSPEVINAPRSTNSATPDSKIEEYENKGYDVHVERGDSSEVLFISAIPQDSPVTHEEWIKICDDWAMGYQAAASAKIADLEQRLTTEEK